MVSFVILHFNNSFDTIRCVNSLLFHLKSENFNIVIVDNGSKNNSGVQLQNYYSNNHKVIVLINDENLGFSRGNNIGCEFAVKQFKPDFLCVFNNDTFISDINFIGKLKNSYSRENFDVLAPMVWNTVRKFNHNPFKVFTSQNQVEAAIKQAIFGRRILNSPLPYLYYLYMNFWAKSRNAGSDGVHCSALIFSSSYFNRFNEVFPPYTFLYGEENLLEYRRIQHNLIYKFDYELVVYHNHSSSTKSTTTTVVNKWKFQNKHILDSLKILRKVYQLGEYI